MVGTKRKKRQSDNRPGGSSTRHIYGRFIAPTPFPTKSESFSIAARARRNVRSPLVSRDGVFLMGDQLHDEILRDGDPAKLAELSDGDKAFLEDIVDKRQAYAEVGRPWRSSMKQDRWLSDIYRRVVSGPETSGDKRTEG